ncbi:MAG: efflux RND transporter periplasmic adaptor subunit [Acidobacteria bacterium]|jgi:HlyD family secretion protein|nr:efflux RND transporter periplasmic adaptor subunit [Acidobacteriota bacterium]
MALSRKAKIIIGATAAVLLTIIVIASVYATRKDTPEVTVVKVETRRELRSNVTASGEIRPIQFINLTSEVQGRIEEIFVKEGDKVAAGTPLVKLDPTQLQSSTDAQVAAFQASQNEAQVTRSQVLAAQNQLSQSQQGLNASEAGITTSQQAVASVRESVNRARQELVAAQTDVDRAQVEVNAANRELKRSAELLESDVISRLEYDQAKDRVENAQVGLRNARSRLQSQQIAIKSAQSQVNEAEARVAEARARAKQQEVAVKDARRGVDTANYSANASTNRSQQQAAVLSGQRQQRDKTMQVAPINGVIADIPTKVGVFALAGNSTTPLLTIADMSTVTVEVKVDETEIDKVAVGQPVKIKVDALNEREITGEVTQKTPLAVGKSQTSGGLSTNINVQEAKEFRVVIQLNDLTDEIRDSLRPGMSATAVITTKTAENVIAVPLQAVIEKKPEAAPSPTIQGDSAEISDKPKMIKGVYILDGNKTKFVEIETGITGESDIQIIAGLSEGQEVITGPSRILNILKEDTVVKRQVKKEGAETAQK